LVSTLDKQQTEYLLSNITNRTKTVRPNYGTLVFISGVYITVRSFLTFTYSSLDVAAHASC